MWYAWTNVRDIRDERVKEAAEAEAQQAARNAHLASLASGGASSGPHLPVVRSFRGPLVSSVRDDPAPSPPLGTDGDRTRPGTPASVGTPKPQEKKEDETSASLTPPEELIQKLMQAALGREPKPVPIVPMEPADRKPRATPPPPASPPPEPQPREPVRLTEQIAIGHIPMDLTMDVIASQMGGGSMDVDE